MHSIYGSDGGMFNIHDDGGMNGHNGAGSGYGFYRTSGNTTYGPNGISSRIGGQLHCNNRSGWVTVNKVGMNMWCASNGDRYNLIANMLHCSNGKKWSPVMSENEAERIIQAQYT